MILFLLFTLSSCYQVLFKKLAITYSELINEENVSIKLVSEEQEVKGLIYPSVSENIWIFEFDDLEIGKENLQHPASYYFSRIWDKNVGKIDMKKNTSKIRAWKLDKPYDSYIETSLLKGQKWKVDVYPPSDSSIFLSFSFTVEDPFDHKYLQQFRHILEKK